MVYKPLEIVCPNCQEMLHIGFAVNWGISWFHNGSGRVGCKDGGFPPSELDSIIPEDEITNFILANP